jgi:UDP-N-acetylglucosamine diphosphorylase/glucosamine-1-phosphate N-acetyltransferase
MRICIFEDNHWPRFLPLVYFRPVYDLRAGALTLRERIAAEFPRASLSCSCRPALRQLLQEGGANLHVFSPDDPPQWFVNGAACPDPALFKLLKRQPRLETVFVTPGGDIAAAFIGGRKALRLVRSMEEQHRPDTAGAVTTTADQLTVTQYPWDLIHGTSAAIERDFGLLKTRAGSPIAGQVHAGAHLLGKKNIIIGKGTIVQPGVVLDAGQGPIIIGANVVIMPNAVVEGPAFIGDRTVIKIGAKIYHGTSLGAQCKVGGEVEAAIMQSHSNKQHEGFLGHSYLGSWVNIGADTNTSDLKNTYGNVKVSSGKGELIDTGYQFIGLIMGDHSKTGINVMFDTGTIVGVSCNIYGSGIPPKFVPSFSWGGEGEFTEYQLDKSIDTARLVMARRSVMLSKEYERVMRAVHRSTAGERGRKAGRS